MLVTNMPKIIYSENKLKDCQGGITKYPFLPVLNLFGVGTPTIIIKTKYKDDKGLLKHELKHVDQYKSNLFHVLRYKFSRDYRLKCELESYKEQIKEYNYKSIDQCKWIVDALVNKYDLKMTVEYISKKVNEILVEVNR